MGAEAAGRTGSFQPVARPVSGRASTSTALSGPYGDTRTQTSRLRTVAIWLAFLGMVTGGLGLSLGGLTLTLDRALGLVLIPFLVVHLIGNIGPRGPRRLVWLWSGWLVVLLVAASFTDDPMAHLVPFITATIPVAYFSLMTMGPLDGRLVDRLARWLLWANVILGLPVLALRQAAGVNALTAPFVDALGRIKLLTFEPNLLGSVLCCLILVTLPRARMNVTYAALYVLSFVLLLGTLSKMPLVAFVIALVLYSLLRAIALRRGGTLAVILPLWIGGVALTAMIAILPMLQDVYVRLLDRTDAVASRLYLYRLAVQRFYESPIIGRGPGDFSLQDLSVLKAIGAYDRENLWIGQMLLAILHDSGIIGLLVYIGFLVALFYRSAKWIRAGSLDHAGYVAAFASILIASQATTAHLLSLFGIAAGLVGSTPFVLTPQQRKNWGSNWGGKKLGTRAADTSGRPHDQGSVHRTDSDIR